MSELGNPPASPVKPGSSQAQNSVQLRPAAEHQLGSATSASFLTHGASPRDVLCGGTAWSSVSRSAVSYPGFAGETASSIARTGQPGPHGMSGGAGPCPVLQPSSSCPCARCQTDPPCAALRGLTPNPGHGGQSTAAVRGPACTAAEAALASSPSLFSEAEACAEVPSSVLSAGAALHRAEV